MALRLSYLISNFDYQPQTISSNKLLHPDLNKLFGLPLVLFPVAHDSLVPTCRIILYAISLADYDQNDIEVGKNRLLTKEGIDRLALYHTSIGRLLSYLKWLLLFFLIIILSFEVPVQHIFV